MIFLDAIIAMLAAMANAVRQGEKVGVISNLDLNLAEKKRLVNGVSYFRVENPFALYAEGGIFAGVMRVRRPNGLPELVVVTDGLFNGLRPMTKVFLIAHEEAHVERGDIAQYPAADERGCHSMESEKAADLSAARKVGKSAAMMALKETERIVRIIPCRNRAQRLADLNERILALSNATV